MTPNITILTLCLCLCVAVNSQKSPVSFDDALLQRFAPDIFNGTWISSNEYIYDDENSVVKYNVDTDTTSSLLNRTVFEKFNLTDVSVSADGKWVAVEHDEQSIFRHSTTSLYTIIELDTGKHYILAEGKRVQLVVWAPVGAGLAYVMENNIYYQAESDRLRNTYKQITNSTRDVYNGVADWVYEEEVLEDTKALWFSPNGTKLVFATLNDTNVRNVTFWRYGNPVNWKNGNPGNFDQYVQAIVIKYPKVGTNNPVAYLNYVDLQSEHLSSQKIKTPEELVTSDNILGPVSWADESHFSVTWLERLQTKAFTLLCSVDGPSACDTVYAYEEKNGWLDIKEPVWVNSSAFLTVLPQDQGGEHGNYRQLSLVQAGHSTPLTSGLGVVIAIECYDRQNNIVYYSSTVNGNSAKKFVYKLDLNDPESKECFSCKVKEDCSYGSASFSKTCANAMISCLGPSVPEFHIYNKDRHLMRHLNNNSELSELLANVELSIKQDLSVPVPGGFTARDGRLMRHLNNNSELSELLTNVELPIKQDLSVPVPGGFTARVRLLLPPNLDKSGRTKYPVLFYVYSGPDSNKISDAWTLPGWHEYLATQRQVVIVNMDGRGSGLRGDKIKFSIYHKLGGPEIEDILTVGKYIQETFPFVDALRTAIWGWSYGGFATAMTLARDKLNIFRCGISVAPVTNWIYYDTVYTERYMGLPTNESNIVGYMNSDVNSKVENFRHKLYYLIHGNADDNVHYQQSMMLSRALELADILFFQQSYPDETHALSHVRRHLYHSMDKFWTRCFHLNSSDYLQPGYGGDLSSEYSAYSAE